MSQVFAFNSLQVRTLIETDQIWFAAVDVCRALGISWRGNTLAVIPDAWQGMRSFRTPSSSDRGGGNQNLRVISEPAVYKLAFRSNKPEADAFTNWVASEVLPAIRKGGRYEAAPKQLPLPAPAFDPSHYISSMRLHSRKIMDEWHELAVALKDAYPVDWNRQLDRNNPNHAVLPLWGMTEDFSYILGHTLDAIQNHAEAFARVKRL